MANEPGFKNIHEIRVLWTDADPAGITFYGNYFRWMDESAYYLFKAAGIEWEKWQEDWGALGIPILSAHADYRSPSKFGDLLSVESFVSEWGTSSFTVSHIFTNSDRIAAEGWEKRVWCKGDPADPSTFSSTPIPDAARTALGGKVGG